MAAVVVAVVLLVVALTSGGGSSAKHKGAGAKGAGAPGAAGQGDARGLPAPPSIAPGADSSGSSAAAGGRKPLPGAPGYTEIPLNVSVSNTKGLKDGDTVTLHVTPKPGSLIYGFEAFMCRGGTSYVFDTDIRPSDTAKCVAHPLSPASQDYEQVKAVPPYTSVDATFRVGVGTDHFQTEDGRAASVICGPNDPCAIVLKLQFPNGFGIEAFPVTYR